MQSVGEGQDIVWAKLLKEIVFAVLPSSATEGIAATFKSSEVSVVSVLSLLCLWLGVEIKAEKPMKNDGFLKRPQVTGLYFLPSQDGENNAISYI